MLVESNSVLRLRDGLALYGGESESKYWLFDTISGKHFSLNHVGFTALSLLDGVRSVKEIVRECANHYAVDDGIVSSDIIEFLTGCIEKELVNPQGQEHK